jgi:hypothetical protein
VLLVNNTPLLGFPQGEEELGRPVLPLADTKDTAKQEAAEGQERPEQQEVRESVARDSDFSPVQDDLLFIPRGPLRLQILGLHGTKVNEVTPYLGCTPFDKLWKDMIDLLIAQCPDLEHLVFFASP